MTSITSNYSVFSPFHGTVATYTLGTVPPEILQLERDIQKLSDLTNPNGGPIATAYANDTSPDHATYFANFSAQGGFEDQISQLHLDITADVNNAVTFGVINQDTGTGILNNLGTNSFQFAWELGSKTLITDQADFTKFATTAQIGVNYVTVQLMNMFPPL
jgi:hypothetical protein